MVERDHKTMWRENGENKLNTNPRKPIKTESNEGRKKYI